MDKELIIDTDKCLRCGQCAAIFPENISFDDETGGPKVISNKDISDNMQEICPVGAISVVDANENVENAAEQDNKAA